MNAIENKMIELLIDLKKNHHCIGIKADFEAEGTRIEEALRLKEVITSAELGLTMKIGGCEALRDIYDAKIIGVKAIVAPMIESAYAFTKYIHATKFAFNEDERKDTKFWINIETETGFNNIDAILATKEALDLEGIVLGRVDMSKSLNLSRNGIESTKLLDTAKVLAKKTKEAGKKFTIGGGISDQSLPFLEKIQTEGLNRVETRKVIFDAPSVINCHQFRIGLQKSVHFELMWLQNKRNFYGHIYNEDIKRLSMLESRYEQLCMAD